MFAWLSVALAGSIHPVLGHEVQWLSAWDDAASALYETANATPYGGGTLTRDQWDDVGVTDTTWWVLPADGGAAVEVEVADVVFRTPGECGGFMGIAVVLDGPEAFAATPDDPPESWRVPVPAPDPDIARQFDAWLALHTDEAGDGHHWYRAASWAAAGDTAVVRLTDQFGFESERDDVFGYLHIESDLRIDATGTHETSRRTYYQYAPALRIEALRDVDGDGLLDVIEGRCARVVRSLSGQPLYASIQNVCCGC